MAEDVIKGLNPQTLWERFYEISQVPRPSKKEGKIREHLKQLAKKFNVDFNEDGVGNIVMYIPANKGYENSPVVILQGHVDMVCEKNKSTKHDFDNDPIKLMRQDGWITADGTTLGSDNGIGVAAALSVITDKEIIHGPVEILLTIDEETGLTGATNLDSKLISGKFLLNMDSEEDGVFYVGCAGGQDTIGTFNIETEPAQKSFSAYDLMVTGLKGGHSGLDINTGRANGIKLLTRTLRALDKINYSIASLEGGSLRNAIPREAEAVILLDSKDEKQAQKIVEDFQKSLANEFNTAEKSLVINFKKSDKKIDKVFKKEFAKKIINTLLALPHGVITMSPDIPELVETSTNVATINCVDNNLVIGTSQRSSIESAKKYVVQNVESVFNLAGAKINMNDGYPGWKPNLNSDLLKISKKVYKDLFNNEPEIKAIHAGLECGILEGKRSGIEMISFGPTIEGAHSPDERVNIQTVEKFYQLMKGILKELADMKN